MKLLRYYSVCYADTDRSDDKIQIVLMGQKCLHKRLTPGIPRRPAASAGLMPALIVVRNPSFTVAPVAISSTLI